MADHTHNGSFGASSFDTPSLRLKLGLAEMLKGGVIMDVMNVEQARIAEEAGAISVMALERVPAMIRAEGGVARMANPKLIKEIMATVTNIFGELVEELRAPLAGPIVRIATFPIVNAGERIIQIGVPSAARASS